MHSSRRVFLLAVSGLALGFACSATAGTVYTISDRGPRGTGIGLGQAVVTGTLTTDGTAGPLAAGNILTWNLTVTCPIAAWCLGSNYTFSGGSSGVTLTGDGLVATPTQLTYHFGAPGYLEFGNTTQGWELGITGFSPGEVVYPNSSGGTSGLRFVSDVETIGTASAPTPEPATFATFYGLALFFLGRKLRFHLRHPNRSRSLALRED